MSIPILLLRRRYVTYCVFVALDAMEKSIVDSRAIRHAADIRGGPATHAKDSLIE